MLLLLIFVLIVLSGLLAGFFFAWWCSCMIGLARVRDSTFVEAMQAINASLPNARFVLPFFAPVMLAPIAAVALLTSDHRESGGWAVVAAIFSFLTFGITAGRNVPLNTMLAKASAGDATEARKRFEMPWVRWNSVRTLTSVVAFVASLMALVRMR